MNPAGKAAITVPAHSSKALRVGQDPEQFIRYVLALGVHPELASLALHTFVVLCNRPSAPKAGVFWLGRFGRLLGVVLCTSLATGWHVIHF